MNWKRFLGATSAALMIVMAILMLVPDSGAQSKYKTLYKFRGDKDGTPTPAGLVMDAAGSLYGTTEQGGAHGAGTVFKLTSNPDGSWKKKVLHHFRGGTDGGNPRAGLIFDKAGSVYGTTLHGGDARWNCGVVFKLTPNPDGSWTKTVLHSFDNTDGYYPVSDLIFDQAGNLYGTTVEGGAKGKGVVFKLTPNPDGSWTESVLHSFRRDGKDGYAPGGAALIFDPVGNLYGTTPFGGVGHNAGGVVFKLTPNPDGSWTESVLHSFKKDNRDGFLPYGALIFDPVGNLYGTTVESGTGCGSAGCGVVFELTPNADGSWTEKVLHHFTLGKDGGEPNAGVTFDQTGNLYGATQYGGNLSYCDGLGCGVVFKLTVGSDGKWRERVLHTFLDHSGAHPCSGVILDTAGNLYGTTSGDDYLTFGSVFEITP